MHIRSSLALAATLAVTGASAAQAAPVTVNLRVEGLSQTTFEGPVTTDAKTIQMDGQHTCDGTNNGASTTPGPTMTTALDDASIANGFPWQGTWYESGFQDYGIDSIGPDASDFTNNRYWGYAHNWQAANVGGCQQKVGQGDEVLFAYDYFSKAHLLRLSAPQKAETGQAVSVRVVDGQNDAPVPNASVHGALTGADGRAVLSFGTPGTRRLKAERGDSVRSNAAEVCVFEPGTGDCDTPRPGAPAPQGEAGATPQPPPADRTPPVATISSLRDGGRYRRAPRLLRGSVEEDAGIHQVYLRVRMIDSRGCRWLSGRREVFTRARTCATARYIRLGNSADWSYLLPMSLPDGARYIVDVKVLDRALNRDLEQVRFRVTG